MQIYFSNLHAVTYRSIVNVPVTNVITYVAKHMHSLFQLT